MQEPLTSGLETFADAAALDGDPRAGTRRLEHTALGALGIELLECSPRHVIARMPVHDPVERGSLLVLAESVASTAGGLAAGPGRRAFGAELDAAFLGPAHPGPVIAEATPYLLGADLQCWRIAIVDAAGTHVLEGRCTLSVVDAPAAAR